MIKYPGTGMILSREALNISAFCSDHQLGKIPGRKRQADDAGERPHESCNSRRFPRGKCLQAARKGNG